MAEPEDEDQTERPEPFFGWREYDHEEDQEWKVDRRPGPERTPKQHVDRMRTEVVEVAIPSRSAATAANTTAIGSRSSSLAGRT